MGALQKTVDIQTKMLACTLDVEEADVLRAVTLYTEALMLLDQYDHQWLEKPEGNQPIYRITYADWSSTLSIYKILYSRYNKNSVHMWNIEKVR